MITLTPEDYWHLRALTADLDRAQLEAALAETRVELARTRRQACWTTLAVRVGIPADRRYGMRDDDCALVDVDPAAVTPA